MATHDYIVDNQNGANFRSDLNNALAAIVSNNSSATAPTTTYAFMWWADTANDILKQRNAADSAWISILTLSTGAPLATIANFTSTGIDDNATSTAITIDASENVGIGTTSPAQRLHITGGRSMFYSTDNYAIGVGKAADLGGYMGSDGVNEIVFSEPGGVERMRLSAASGDLRIATGNLVIGTSGKGIDFSADGNTAGMTSEVLDDYEEGTWTPGWTGSGGAPSGVNYSKRVGTYVKVGNSVTIIGNIAVSSWSSAPTGNLQISGLPFTNGSEDGSINIGNAKYIDCNGTALMGQLNANATTIDLYGYNDNASYANSTAANTGSSNFIWFSATYII